MYSERKGVIRAWLQGTEYIHQSIWTTPSTTINMFPWVMWCVPIKVVEKDGNGCAFNFHLYQMSHCIQKLKHWSFRGRQQTSPWKRNGIYLQSTYLPVKAGYHCSWDWGDHVSYSPWYLASNTWSIWMMPIIDNIFYDQTTATADVPAPKPAYGWLPTRREVTLDIKADVIKTTWIWKLQVKKGSNLSRNRPDSSNPKLVVTDWGNLSVSFGNDQPWTTGSRTPQEPTWT